MPENNKQNSHVRSEDFKHDNVPQPKGKFVDPFKGKRPESEREAESARSRRQD